MKLIIGLIALSLAIITVNVEADEEKENIFEKSFRDLHGEPLLSPLPPAISRKTSWIKQKLDHFNENEKRTWKMRYMSNDEFFQEGGPIFIFVGGEWAISSAFVSAGHFYDMAKEHHGYLFYTEHRYYGESKPTRDVSNTNLIKYLHVKQALADLAHFIRTMKASPKMANSKVIMAGSSYSATMVTWFKKVYPELVTGCWASSAPLLAKVDFVEYKEIVGQSIKLVGGADCYNRIQSGFAKMEHFFATKQGAQVKKILNLCDTFDEKNYLDVWTLFSEISDKFGHLVKSHYDHQIQRVCKKIMTGQDDVSGVTSFLLEEYGKGCHDLSYKAILSTITHSEYTNSSKRQWTFQTCNEYGWYQTSDSVNQPFGTQFPLKLYTKMCADAYGKEFTNEFIDKQVEETNKYFGGLKPEVENVYFTQGQLDPWRALGLQDKEHATVIPLYSHSMDLSSITELDSPEMRASKERIAELVREWVKDSDQKFKIL